MGRDFPKHMHFPILGKQGGKVFQPLLERKTCACEVLLYELKVQRTLLLPACPGKAVFDPMTRFPGDSISCLTSIPLGIIMIPMGINKQLSYMSWRRRPQMKAKIYETVSAFNQGIEQVLGALQALELYAVVERQPLRSCRNRLEELRAEINHSVVSQLSGREEKDWALYGRRTRTPSSR